MNGDSEKHETRPDERCFPSGSTEYRLGLTKREFFAAAALAGLTAYGYGDNIDHELICHKATVFADSLIDQLNKP